MSPMSGAGSRKRNPNIARDSPETIDMIFMRDRYFPGATRRGSRWLYGMWPDLVLRQGDSDGVLVSCPVNKLTKSATDFRGWQDVATSNSTAIARSHNAASGEKTCRIRQVICGTGH